MDYVVGSVAALISGNVTPNRPKLISRALTPRKHQLSPNVTPKSEMVEDRSIFLSPTLQKKKAIVKKSPKRIFENPDLDATNDGDRSSSLTSPKVAAVKKHLKEQLGDDGDSTKVNKSHDSPKNKTNSVDNKSYHEKSVVDMEVNLSEINESTPKKKKKQKSLPESVESLYPLTQNGPSELGKSPGKTKNSAKKLMVGHKSTIDETEPSDTEDGTSLLETAKSDVKTNAKKRKIELKNISNGSAKKLRENNKMSKNQKRRLRKKLMLEKRNLNKNKTNSDTVINQSLKKETDSTESKSKQKKSPKKRSISESDDTNNENLNPNKEETQNISPKKKNKKKNKQDHNEENQFNVENTEEVGEVDKKTEKESKPTKQKKNKTVATILQEETVDESGSPKKKKVKSKSENMSQGETKSCSKKKKTFVNPNAITDKDSDSEHESDDEIESETEEINKKALETTLADQSSDEEADEPVKETKPEIIEHKMDEEEIKRTLFVGNVPFSAKCKKQIKRIFDKYGKILTVRIRTVPVKDARVTPKLAVIKKELHPERTTVNMYIKFQDPESVEKALVENNTLLEENHLRVTRSDRTGAEHDPRLAVFVGNLPFAIEDDTLRAKFEKCGQIESVRVVRDKKTNAGKGFGYVNFASKDGVELALNLSEEDLTIKNRILRVKRCTQMTQKQPHRQTNPKWGPKPEGDGVLRRLMHKRQYQDGNTDGPPNKRPRDLHQPQKEKKARKEFVGMTAEKKKKRKFDKGQKKKKVISQILTNKP